jgi:hypothetical protein
MPVAVVPTLLVFLDFPNDVKGSEVKKKKGKETLVVFVFMFSVLTLVYIVHIYICVLVSFQD